MMGWAELGFGRDAGSALFSSFLLSLHLLLLFIGLRFYLLCLFLFFVSHVMYLPFKIWHVEGTMPPQYSVLYQNYPTKR